MIDRESDKIDSTDDLLRESEEIHEQVEPQAAEPAKPMFPPWVKWVIIADFMIIVAVISVITVKIRKRVYRRLGSNRSGAMNVSVLATSSNGSRSQNTLRNGLKR